MSDRMTGPTSGTRLPRQVLVTGAAGIIGRAVVQHLRAQGIGTTALVQSDSPEPPEADRLVIGDTTRTAPVARALTGCDAVVHLAALAHPSLGTPYEVYRNNVNSTFNVLAQAAERGIGRAVIASSIQAPGIGLNPRAPLPAYFPLDEQLPSDVADPYSLSKQADELTARMAARAWGMRVVALRFPLVKTVAELRTIQKEVEADPADMMRTGWAYLTDRDAARAVLAALEAAPEGARVIGLSAADTLLDRPTAELLDEFAPGVPRRRPFRGRAALVDTTAAEQRLGFIPRQSLHDAADEPEGDIHS
jgi:nucleoside-diphosphate-sugar epimerase